MLTYTVNLKTCDSLPSIECSIPNVPKSKVGRIVAVAQLAYRSVEVVCEQTGEIAITIYSNDDFFNPVYNYGETIDTIRDIYIEQELE